MLQSVDVGVGRLEPYREFVDAALLDEIRHLAGGLRGARIVHVNATPYGGGVSEILRSLVPLARALDLQVDWKIIHGEPEFFKVTKAFHNALQGAEYVLTEAARETYEAYGKRNAEELGGGWDYVVAHDPQTAAMRYFYRNRARWAWRCHIDTSEPNDDVWQYLRPFVELHDAVVFTRPEFAPPNFRHRRICAIPPAIDPLSPKNVELPPHLARGLLEWVGVETHKPLMAQVSRFDPWKDPDGVIQAYRLVRERVPGLQLALVGSMALDDPEAWDIYHRLIETTKGDLDVHILTNLVGISNVEVNAIQRLSDVVVQKSIREGFGLVVSETLWKGTPVVAGRTGGIPMQLQDGESGYLVTDVEECATRVHELLEHPERSRDMGARGREYVGKHFLLPRLLRDELKLLADL